MKIDQLLTQIQKKQSFLCVGLDVDINKIPPHLRQNPDELFEFSKAIIEATSSYAVAYKPNLAFFEAYGVQGMQALEKIMKFLNANYPEIFTIADAKRGDIGNTSTRYAKAYFESYGFDSITVAPYMGKDSVEPFLAFEDKHTILLALTSNAGASDFQYFSENEKPLYKKVIETAKHWKGSERLMYVVGATKANALKEIRQLLPDAFLLVPGVGAQGGSLEEVAKAGLNDHVGLLVNSSRAIIYASSNKDFAEAARQQAQALQGQMAKWLKNIKLI